MPDWRGTGVDFTGRKGVRHLVAPWLSFVLESSVYNKA